MDNDSLTYLEYGIYLLVSLSVTIWVGRTLFRSGRPFLLEAFHGNETMADSVNNLLIIGFYLVNAGFMLLFLSSKEHPKNGSPSSSATWSSRTGSSSSFPGRFPSCPIAWPVPRPS